MNIEANWITGFMVGIEFFNEEMFGSGMILDCGIFRLMFSKD